MSIRPATKLFLAIKHLPKNAKLKIQNKNIDAITDPDGYPPRSSLTLETIDNAGQGRFTLRAQSKYDTINKKYYQYDLVGTSDGILSWTGGNYYSLGHIEIVDSMGTDKWYDEKYVRYSSGLQICWDFYPLVARLQPQISGLLFQNLLLWFQLF